MQAESNENASIHEDSEALMQGRMASILGQLSDAVGTLLRTTRIGGVERDVALHWLKVRNALEAGLKVRGPVTEAEPTPDEIVRMWKGLSLLRHVMPSQAQIALAVAAGTPMRAIARHRDQRVRDVEREFASAIRAIALAEVGGQGREA